MLEVINGPLLLYFVVLVTLSSFMATVVQFLTSHFTVPTKEEKNIWTDILKLKSERSNISMKDEFAAYSKLQRKIIKLESQLKELSQNRKNNQLTTRVSIQFGLQVVLTIMMVGSVIWFRREPLVVIKANLFPLASTLSYPSSTPNAISTHVWVVITNVSIRTLLKPLISK